MSFRGRLWIALNDQSEKGKSDAAIASGLRTAIALHDDAAVRARSALRRIAAQRGRSGGIAAATAPLVRGGTNRGTMSVSVTEPREFVLSVKRFSGLEATVSRPAGARALATTVPGASPRDFESKDGMSDAEIRKEMFRGRSTGLSTGDQRMQFAVFQSSETLEASVADNRRLILGVLMLFFLLALAFSTFVSRALHAQIQTFLVAARRVASGDFAHSVPTHGRDEFAQLGEEFNSMSDQLAGKIEEVERKRTELEDTIRRVGDAFAAGLDRQGVVELAVRTAADACEAEAARVLPLDRGVLRPVRVRAFRPRARRGARGGGAPGVRGAAGGRDGVAGAGRSRGLAARAAASERGAGGRFARARHADARQARDSQLRPICGGDLDRAARARVLPPRASCSSTSRARLWSRSRTATCTRRSSTRRSPTSSRDWPTCASCTACSTTRSSGRGGSGIRSAWSCWMWTTSSR